MTLALRDLKDCFQGVIPSMIATCSKDGVPNVTYLSQVYFVDDRHVALSCQFFNKTRRNIDENPYATVVVYDPKTFEARRLELRFVRSETSGALFDAMALRIRIIASHTGMADVFRLTSADVFEVVSIEAIDAFLTPPDEALERTAPVVVDGPITELKSLQRVLNRVDRAACLEELLSGALLAAEEEYGFKHSMALLLDDATKRLTVLASRGYGVDRAGAEVALGEGLIGATAERRAPLRMTGLLSEMSYGRAVRDEVLRQGGGATPAPEIPLPGLADAQAQLALPLHVDERLLGVLAFEDRDPLAFDEWDEAYLQIVADQVARAIDRVQRASDDDDEPPPKSGTPQALAAAAAPSARPLRKFLYYRKDDCVFVDGDYLVRNVPGKLLWKMLTLRDSEGRVEFCNREFRLDASLGLPTLKDNLESRLILLRKRLLEKCPDIRIVPVRRGRFALEVDCEIELREADGA